MRFSINTSILYKCVQSSLIPSGPNIKELMMSHMKKTLLMYNWKTSKHLQACMFMNSHWHGQILKGLIAELNKTTFPFQLQRIYCRKRTACATKQLATELQKYEDIQGTSQMVSNDLTTGRLNEIKRFGPGIARQRNEENRAKLLK